MMTLVFQVVFSLWQICLGGSQIVPDHPSLVEHDSLSHFANFLGLLVNPMIGFQLIFTQRNYKLKLFMITYRKLRGHGKLKGI